MFYSALFLLSVLSFLGQSYGQEQCFIPGECIDGTSSGISYESSSADCLTSCQDSQLCEYFTFYESEQICILYETCPEVSADNCDDCIYGTRGCMNEQCNAPGSCVDQLVGVGEAFTRDDCIRLCHDNEECMWWTFVVEENLCELFSGCDHFNSECEICISGERTCEVKSK